eukprot:scaffold25349_cov37-Tisochrysis_lutea.AAC.2
MAQGGEDELAVALGLGSFTSDGSSGSPLSHHPHRCDMSAEHPASPLSERNGASRRPAHTAPAHEP